MEKTPSSPTLLVGCKLPNGLVMELLTAPEVDPATGQIKGRLLMPAPVGEMCVLRGSNSLLRLSVSAIGPPAQGMHRYATTRVPEEFGREWFRRNAELECVKRGLVFIVEDQRNPKPEIRERETDPQTRTGLEALAESKDPRMPRAPRPGAPNVATPDTESMAQLTGVAHEA